MIRIQYFVVLVVLLLGGSGFAQTTPTEQAKDLHLVFVGTENNPQFKWFESNRDLAALRSRCNWSHLKPTDSIFKERYAPIVGTDVPMVLFMRSDGGLIHLASGASMPKQASILFADMAANYKLARSSRPAEQITEQYDASSNPPCVGPNCPLPPRTPDALPVVDTVIDFSRHRLRDGVFDKVDSMTERATYQIAGAILIGFLMLLVGLGLFLILLRR